MNRAMKAVTAVFDIGKTNKKFFLFDEDFREVYREYTTFREITDEDGYPTEDLHALQSWLREVFDRILEAEEYNVRAINFSSYGASFVHLDRDGEVLTPLYNYTKPLDPALSEEFYAKYGPEDSFARRTGSPAAGLLNSGLQLYWLKHRRPEVFARLKYSLHLPQYLSYVFTGIPVSEYTGIGCHTALWDYTAQDYHPWVYAEELHRILPPIVSTETSINMNYNGRRIKIGVGIHDSSAALLPYVRSQKKPFVLVSTGTWSISLNPFTENALTQADLDRNCLNYMRIDGRPVKAARLFLGKEYQTQVDRLAAHYGLPDDWHHSVRFDSAVYDRIMADFEPRFHWDGTDGHPVSGRHQATRRRSSLRLPPLTHRTGEPAGGRHPHGRRHHPARKNFHRRRLQRQRRLHQLLTHHFRELEVRTTDASLGSALGAALCISDAELNSNFLKKNYSLKKHLPFIIQNKGKDPLANAPLHEY